MPAKKFIIKRTEPMRVEEEVFPFTPVKDGPTAMHAVLAILLEHTSDVFHAVVEAISDHYKIDKEEMMDAVLNHPVYKKQKDNFVFIDMGYLPNKDTTPPPPEKPVEETVKPKKKFKIKPITSSTEFKYSP